MAEEGRARLLAREAIRVESDLQRDAARALEMLHVQLISAVIDPYSWKWVLSVLHYTVQAFVVAARTPDLSAVEQIAEEELEIDLPAGSDDARAGTPLDLVQRARELVGDAWTDELERDLRSVIAYRQALIERFPARWSLGISDLPSIVRSGLRVIEILGWAPGRIAWRKKRVEDLARVKLMASIKVIEALERQRRGE